MRITVIVLQGSLELFGLLGFLTGFFSDVWWLVIAGGCLVVVDDVIEIGLGILNPTVPVLLAIFLAVVMTPWYLGVFWASAVFKILNVPAALMKMFAPRAFARKAMAKLEHFG